jgi:hypothetical protein
MTRSERTGQAGNTTIVFNTEPDFSPFAVGKGNDFLGQIHGFGLLGFEFYVLVFFFGQ